MLLRRFLCTSAKNSVTECLDGCRDSMGKIGKVQSGIRENCGDKMGKNLHFLDGSEIREKMEISVDQISRTLDMMGKMRFKGKDLENLIVQGDLDIDKRLQLLSSCFKDVVEEQEIKKNIIFQQKRWIFGADSGVFSENLKNLRELLMVFKKFKVDLTKWMVQLQPTPKEKIQGSMEFLSGFVGNERDLRRMVQRFPILIQFDIDKHLKPRLKVLREVGFSDEQLVKIIARYPRILSVAREERMDSIFSYMEGLGLSKEEVCKLVSSFPRLTTTRCEAVSKRVEYFVSCGVNIERIRMLIKKNPSALTLNIETGLKPKLEFLTNIGYKEKDVAHLLSLHAGVLGRTKEGLEARFNQLIKWGLTKTQSGELLRREPSIFNLREQLLNEKVEFYTRIMKQEVSDLLVFSAFLTLSLERRLRPRFKFQCEVYLFGLARREYVPYYLVRITEKTFQSKFIDNEAFKELTR